MSLETESKSAKDSELKFTQKKNIININEQNQKQIQLAVSVKLLLWYSKVYHYDETTKKENGTLKDKESVECCLK